MHTDSKLYSNNCVHSSKIKHTSALDSTRPLIQRTEKHLSCEDERKGKKQKQHSGTLCSLPVCGDHGCLCDWVEDNNNKPHKHSREEKTCKHSSSGGQQASLINQWSHTQRHSLCNSFKTVLLLQGLFYREGG